MRKSIILMISAAFTVAAPAQEALRCVNPDVLNSLVFRGNADARLVVKRSMPDLVAGFGAPVDFTLIGSGVRGQNLATVVAYKTPLASDKAFSNWLTFLDAEGWRRETTQATQEFTVAAAGPTPLTARLCRDGERRSMTVQEIAGVRYATISGSPTSTPRACNAPIPQQGFDVNSQIAARNAIRANLPQFSFPATARSVGQAGTGGANSGNISSTTTRIESPDTAASLAAQLASQLVRQGWRSDAEWKGTLSTGSTWTRTADDGNSYLGTLEILSMGQGAYNVGFTVASRTRQVQRL